MLRYLFIPILIVGCVQPAIKRPTTTLPEQDPLQGANRLEHYLSSLNEMCSENPQRISSLIEVGYQDLARIGPREPMLDTVNDLHLIALTGHLRMKKQIDCSALISSYFFLRVQQGVSAEDATNGLIETYAQLRPSELSGNPYKFVTATRLCCMNGIFFCLVWLKKDRFLSRLGMHFRPKIHALSAKEPVMANLSSCPPAVKSRRRGVKEQYRLRNWPAYNAGLKQRGSLTVWCSPDVADGWYYQGPNKRGAQYTFSDVAIQTVLTLGMIYHLPLRQAEGFTDSVLVLMGLALRVPDYSTLSRRQADQAGSLSPPPPRGPIHLVVDATGLKVYGEGAWKVRQHGVSQRRTWRKLHLGVDEATGQIVAQTLTTAGVDDGSQVEPLLEQVQAPIEAVGGDGAYDQRKVFDALAASEPPIQPIIPPRIKAKIQQHGNTKAEPLPRDETLRAIRKKGRQAWKKTSGYHRRSIVETHIGRYKKILGDTLSARTLPNQQTETRLGCALLNRMLQLAKPESYPITQKD